VLVLGISCGHDANVCLVSEQGVVLHYEKERFTGIKHDSGAVDELIRLALSDVGITMDDVDLVASSIPVWPERGMTGRLISGELYNSVFSHSRHEVEVLGRRLPGIYVPHHVGHMAYAYFFSPFSDADVIAIDAYGNFTATAVGVGSGAQLRATMDLHPGNIGSLWAMTSRAVFGDILAAGKLMGLAPYGEPRFVPSMRERYIEDVQGFALPRDPWRDNADIPWLPRGTPLSWTDPIVMDFAASVQTLTTEVLLDLVRGVSARTGRRQLCLSGGVALNGIANEAIIASGLYDDVFIPPAVYDGGLSLGFALYALAEETGEQLRPGDPRYLGRRYPRHAIDETARAAAQKYAVRKITETEVSEVAATALRDGKTIALWYGRAESGPRALGHRSILSDPRPRERRDYLNQHVKSREAFRPFGPSVLAEHVGEICDMAGTSPYMLRVVGVLHERRDDVPAITHVDGSTRPQTVGPDDVAVGPLRSILKSFAQSTGCPAVLNTSFNIKGQPIVETPANALETFSASPLDLLILEDWLIERN
jgi:carbamoyltransferase